MVRIKTSIYVEEELWRKLKRYAAKKGVEISRFLEELIVDEMFEEELCNTLSALAGSERYEIDFVPVEPEKGYSVSDLVRVMRDERADNIS